MFFRFHIFLIGLIACCGLLTTTKAETNNPLLALRPEHPRLLWLEDDPVADDDLANRLRKNILERAEGILPQPPVERVLEGHRMLDVSRTAFRHILALATAWRLTDDPRFLERAEAEMLAAAEFEDWNPKHFLDVAEMTAALAIGYDWLYPALSDSSRERIRTAIVEKGLKPALRSDKAELFTEWTNNWNQVCNGGIVMGALAVADYEPEMAETLVRRAINGVPTSMAAYAPDGVYPEGPMYWAYGTDYNVLLIAALESALGDSFGLDEMPGFARSAAFMRQSSGPSGKAHNFSDGKDAVRARASLYWMSNAFGIPEITEWQDGLLRKALVDGTLRSRLESLLLLWRQPGESSQQADPPLSWIGQGPNPVAYLRSGWDSEALFVGIKAGRAAENHGHMDSGSFVLDRDGVRWVIDPTYRPYIEFESAGVNLWGKKQDSERWKIFETGPFSHATLTIDGQLHQVDAKAELTRTETTNQSVAVDLSGTLSAKASRKFELLPGRSLRIRDRLSGLQPGTQVRWAIPTPADVERHPDGAILRQSGHQLSVNLNSQPKAELTVEPWDDSNPPWRVPTPETRMLVAIVTAGDEGVIEIDATFANTIPLAE